MCNSMTYLLVPTLGLKVTALAHYIHACFGISNNYTKQVIQEHGVHDSRPHEMSGALLLLLY